jgi:hypothetical protein
MLDMLKNLTKAATAVALTPLALVADIVTLPASALKYEPPFKATGTLLEIIADNAKKSVK